MGRYSIGNFATKLGQCSVQFGKFMYVFFSNGISRLFWGIFWAQKSCLTALNLQTQFERRVGISPQFLHCRVRDSTAGTKARGEVGLAAEEADLRG